MFTFGTHGERKGGRTIVGFGLVREEWVGLSRNPHRSVLVLHGQGEKRHPLGNCGHGSEKPHQRLTDATDENGAEESELGSGWTSTPRAPGFAEARAVQTGGSCLHLVAAHGISFRQHASPNRSTLVQVAPAGEDLASAQLHLSVVDLIRLPGIPGGFLFRNTVLSLPRELWRWGLLSDTGPSEGRDHSHRSNAEPELQNPGDAVRDPDVSSPYRRLHGAGGVVVCSDDARTSFATSVPAVPVAKPTSAFFRAGPPSVVSPGTAPTCPCSPTGVFSVLYPSSPLPDPHWTYESKDDSRLGIDTHSVTTIWPEPSITHGELDVLTAVDNGEPLLLSSGSAAPGIASLCLLQSLSAITNAMVISENKTVAPRSSQLLPLL
ncbi:hypothetical protein H920_14815 [Fukomys damarensis]|uniref:Uncharacterized protein n=1 Tax=Fukomys damarensis TaxID=885580 RepID=A0A091DLC3_FUKDA|nr:hypothetical protein H920_14815 [Fukomys damarensis]